MYANHIELEIVETMFRAQGECEENVKKSMELLNWVYEIGYRRGHQDAILERMMGEK